MTRLPTWPALACALLAYLALLGSAHADEPAAAPPGAASPTAAQEKPVLEPPRAATSTAIDLPDGVTQIDKPVVVRVRITVASDGSVKKVELLSDPQPPFDEAVLKAAQGWRFHPAKYGGKPVAVAISYTHTFLPKPKAVEVVVRPGGPVLNCVLRGKLVEKGTRVPVQGASLSAKVGGETYAVEADARGRFRVMLPAGKAEIRVHAPSYKAFLQYEQLQPQQEVAVAYYVERERYDPYEITVYGDQRREELSRVSLRGPEIKQVPGTFGDPFRVVQALPGVASIMSLLPFPVVRGASPGSTGYLVDGTRVPLLYHMLAGPSVIHPEFIDEIQFYPGGSPVLYGGYTAGIIDGRTRRARPDEHLIDVDMNLLQTGALVRQPIPALGGTATVAGRWGYPGFLMSLATDQASLAYWDYQLRFDGGNARNGYTLFAFGASDTVSTPRAGYEDAANPPLDPSLVLAFHRLDLRAQNGKGAHDVTYRLVSGYDDSLFGATGGVTNWVVEPTVRWHWRPDPILETVVGVEGYWHYLQKQISTTTTSTGGVGDFTDEIKSSSLFAGLAEALYRPTKDWLLRPGVRYDYRSDGSASLGAVDPRLTARYRLLSLGLPEGTTSTVADARSVWLKAGAGVYHQPPRMFVSIPGLDTMPLKYGLLKAVQTSLGAEIPVASGVGLNIEGYYNDMDPVVFDLSINQDTLAKSAPTRLPGEVPKDIDSSNAAQRALDNLYAPQQGRAYGLEVLLRRQSRTGLYGWLAYTLSLSERKRAGEWVPYDFDRTHLLNVVAGMPLPRNWDLGVRLQYQSGKPATTTYGYNTARTEGYFRIDLRVDKRAVYNKWLFDFYVDVTNITLVPEEVVAGSFIRYVLPTVGIRGRL
ncbi:MAG: TonB-dependent receptor [Deltaproteobacteria bacterium]|nr:TonB-dependent receptor [Deltaproteobacteria bacterium]